MRQGRLDIGTGVAAENGNRLVGRNHAAGQILGHTVEIAQLIGFALLQLDRVGETGIVSLCDDRGNDCDRGFVLGARRGRTGWRSIRALSVKTFLKLCTMYSVPSASV